jgi:hypothetical protein
MKAPPLVRSVSGREKHQPLTVKLIRALLPRVSIGFKQCHRLALEVGQEIFVSGEFLPANRLGDLERDYRMAIHGDTDEIVIAGTVKGEFEDFQALHVQSMHRSGTGASTER